MARTKAERKAARAGRPARRATRAVRAARRSRAAAASGEGSNYRQKQRARKQAQGSTKSGCAPKLFMLLLPFAALGTYLFLRS